MAKLNLNNRRGGTLVIVAVMLVVIVGIAMLAVDISRMRMAKQRAQNVADAAAMAAALRLTGAPGDQTPALDEAQAIAAANNAAYTVSQVLDDGGAPGVTATILAEGTSLTLGSGKTVTVGLNQAAEVHCRVKVDHVFAPVFYTLSAQTGPSSASPGATAVAMLASASAVERNLVPWVMPQTALWDAAGAPAPVGQEFTVKVDVWKNGNTGPGNFQCVSYNDDSGSSDYRKRIAGDPNVSPAEVDVGDVLRPENGNMVGPTDQGVGTRIAKSAFPSTTNPCAFTAWQQAGYPQDSRVVIVPVYQHPLPADGGILVVGFAAFFLCSEADGGIVIGHFVTARLDGDSLVYGGTDLSDVTGEPNLVIAPRLVK